MFHVAIIYLTNDVNCDCNWNTLHSLKMYIIIVVVIFIIFIAIIIVNILSEISDNEKRLPSSFKELFRQHAASIYSYHLVRFHSILNREGTNQVLHIFNI